MVKQTSSGVTEVTGLAAADLLKHLQGPWILSQAPLNHLASSQAQGFLSPSVPSQGLTRNSLGCPLTVEPWIFAMQVDLCFALPLLTLQMAHVFLPLLWPKLIQTNSSRAQLGPWWERGVKNMY